MLPQDPPPNHPRSPGEPLPADLPAQDGDLDWLEMALQMADRAAASGEVPVGAVVVCADRLVGSGHNAPIGACDPTAHAEIMALRAAARVLGNYRLPECTLYVTLEPCAMCAGAVLQARLKRLVYAAPDHKSGVCGSTINLFAERRLNSHTAVLGPVATAASARRLRAFFAERRANSDKAESTGGRTWVIP